jgi:hypothetical protein
LFFHDQCDPLFQHSNVAYFFRTFPLPFVSP